MEKQMNLLQDEELVRASQKGDVEATNELLNRYKPLVRKKSNTLFLMGADTEDLIQEGMIGLFMAMRQYDESLGASFKTYANICIGGQMHHAISAASRNKHMPLNEALSLDAGGDEESGEAFLESVLSIRAGDPERLYLDQEAVSDLMLNLKENLSPLEWQVFSRYIEGMSYKDIAKELGKSDKTIDNALHRMKQKVKEYC